MTDARPKLSWSDLAGARVGLWGLGREGRANLRKLHALGVTPVLVDDHPGLLQGSWTPNPAIGGVTVHDDAGGQMPEVLATGEGGLAALEQCDVVVKTPGLSR